MLPYECTRKAMEDSSHTISRGTEATLSVRLKILLAVVGSVVALSLLMYVLSYMVLVDSYLSIERAAVAQNLRRATDAIQEFENQQMIKLSDWAAWDEAYEYGQTRDSEWVDSVIYATGMANLDINIAAFSDTEGNIFYIKGADIVSRAEASTEVAAEYFRNNPHLIRHGELEEETRGIALLPNGPLIVVSLPLRTSEGLGPIPGSITFARYLDAQKVKEISDITHLAISVYPFSSEDLPKDVAEAKETLGAGAERLVAARSSEVIDGYTLIKGIDGAPALIVKVESPRPIYAQGQATFLTFMLSGVAAIIVFGIFILYLLDRLVIARFLRLTKDVEHINDERDITLRAGESSTDEIGLLAKRINSLLSWLQETKEAEANSRREIVNLLDSLKKEKEQREEMERIVKGK